MTDSTENILNIIKTYNGMITVKEAELEGISRKKLERMVNQNCLERVASGLYLHPENFEDSFYTFQYRAPKAVLSHETSLYLHGLSDENIIKITATIPSGYNHSMIKDKNKYKFYYLKEELWKEGQEVILSPFGKEIVVYNKEVALAHMISKINKLDRDLILTALKRGLANKELDTLSLLKYSEIFNCEERMRAYLEFYMAFHLP